jgi:hypothetical protein
MEDFDSKILPYRGSISIPIHPYLEKYYFLDEDAEGSEVEFEIEDFWETGLEQVYKVAKLIKPKEPKQETLEEAAKKYATNHGMMAYISAEKEESFIEGAKWQEERMYSEEEVIEFGEMIAWNMVGKTITESFIKTVSKELFKQFKKKL